MRKNSWLYAFLTTKVIKIFLEDLNPQPFDMKLKKMQTKLTATFNKNEQQQHGKSNVQL